jgi:hypothetical protein
MPNWGQGLSGLTGGALAGSTTGNPLFAIGGGVLGGLAGLFGSDPAAEQQKRWEQFYNQTGGRQAPQLGPAHQAGYSGFRANQSNLINRLEAMSRGEGPSISREMLNQAVDKNTKNQMAMAQSGRGNAALAAQNAANNVGMLNAQASQDAALGRVQEQMGALQALGLNIHGARGADEDMNRYNTGARNNRDEFNVGNQMNMYQLNDAARIAALNGMGGNQGPAIGDTILSGGAGLASFLAGQRANKAGFQQQPGVPTQRTYLPQSGARY